ncbi:hypothetical protein D3C75_439880 [compost metagenome]
MRLVQFVKAAAQAGHFGANVAHIGQPCSCYGLKLGPGIGEHLLLRLVAHHRFLRADAVGADESGIVHEASDIDRFATAHLLEREVQSILVCSTRPGVDRCTRCRTVLGVQPIVASQRGVDGFR